VAQRGSTSASSLCLRSRYFKPYSARPSNTSQALHSHLLNQLSPLQRQSLPAFNLISDVPQRGAHGSQFFCNSLQVPSKQTHGVPIALLSSARLRSLSAALCCLQNFCLLHFKHLLPKNTCNNQKNCEINQSDIHIPIFAHFIVLLPTPEERESTCERTLHFKVSKIPLFQKS